MPNVNVIITNPKQCRLGALKTRLHTIYLLVQAATDKNIEPIMDYIERLDVFDQLIFMRGAGLKDNTSILNNHRVQNWVVKNTPIMNVIVNHKRDQ